MFALFQPSSPPGSALTFCTDAGAGTGRQDPFPNVLRDQRRRKEPLLRFLSCCSQDRTPWFTSKKSTPSGYITKYQAPGCSKAMSDSSNGKKRRRNADDSSSSTDAEIDLAGLKNYQGIVLKFCAYLFSTSFRTQSLVQSKSGSSGEERERGCGRVKDN